MIEKLDIKNGGVEDLLNCIKKLNELIDAVNLLQCKNVHIESDLQDLMYPKEIKGELGENVTISKPEKCETPADPYAEQRKWIGKLCRFWDDNYKITKHFGILTRIDETAIVRYEADNGFWYCACEPVKPDDDIIYKGE